MRCVLYNEHVGYKELDSIDPEGLDRITKILKRSEDNDGVFYEYSLNLKFWVDAREWIVNVYQNYGRAEANISITLYKYGVVTPGWYVYYTGKLKLTNYTANSQFVETSMEQTGFQRKFINAVDQDVSIDGTGMNLELHAKTILQLTETRPQDNQERQFPDLLVYEFGAGNKTFYKDTIIYGQFDMMDAVVNELPTSYPLDYGMTEMGPGEDAAPLGTQTANAGTDAQYQTFLQAYDKDVRNPVYVADIGGAVRVRGKLTYQHSVFARNDGSDVDTYGSGVMGNVEVIAWFEKRNSADVIQELFSLGRWSMERTDGYSTIGKMETKTVTHNTTAAVGDKIYIYYTMRVWSSYEGPGKLAGTGYVSHTFRIKADKVNSYIRIESDTVKPATSTNGQMVHEVFQAVVEKNTGIAGTFYSEHLGRTDIGYLADGRGSMRFITNGRSIRQLPVNTLFVNWEELFQSFTSLDCLSWGFETRDGKPIVRVEPKRYFFNPDSLILELGRVSELEKSFMNTLNYSQVEIGYPKIENINQRNGVDEINSLRRFALPLTQAKSKLILVSPYRASGFEIEAQRRLKDDEEKATEESRLDDANFIVCVMRDGSVFRTEIDETFPELENVLHSSSIYNASITPSRNLRNWKDYLAGMLVGLTDKTLRFKYGEMNYKFFSRRVDEVVGFAEDEDISLEHATPYFVNELYKFKTELYADQMQLIEQNPYGFIRFRDEFNNVKEGYVMRVEHEDHTNKAKMDLLKVYRPI